MNCRIEYGGMGEIPPVETMCPMDHFENMIRQLGVVACCEWFGHSADSPFTLETINLLRERSAEKPKTPRTRKETNERPM